MKNRQVPITNEVRVLKFMRIQGGLSLKKAGRILGVTAGAISHIENGKMNLPWERIEQMVGAYGFSMSEFLKLSRSKKLPNDLRTECETLLKTVPTNRLEEVIRFFKTINLGGFDVGPN